MKRQATRATPEEVRHHIEMQRKHGERMSRDEDDPTWVEVVATLIIAIAAAVAYFW